VLNYTKEGNLISGCHELDIPEFKSEFGWNIHRLRLINGLERAILAFRSFSVKFLYVDGSFVTKKALPEDYDVCYEIPENDLDKLFLFYPVFRSFENNRKRQKEVFLGEFFPATWVAFPPSEIYLNFFQHDKDGRSKGVIKLLL
jgi:hypothetical protein